MDIPPNILIVGGGVFGRKLFSPTTITHNSTPENQTPITPAPLIRISNDSLPPPPSLTFTNRIVLTVNTPTNIL